MRDDTKNDCEGYRDSIKEASKTLILFQMEEDISPTSCSSVKCFDSSIYYFELIHRKLSDVERISVKVVFAKRRISTAYSLVAAIAVLQFLYV